MIKNGKASLSSSIFTLGWVLVQISLTFLLEEDVCSGNDGDAVDVGDMWRQQRFWWWGNGGNPCGGWWQQLKVEELILMSWAWS